MPKPISKAGKGTVYIGIDPGKAGGLVSILPSGEIAGIPMPETELEIWFWFTVNMRNSSKMVAFIEKVHSMPDQGIASAFTFGAGFGGLRMALTAAGATWEEVSPQKWQKEIGFPQVKGEVKRSRKLRLISFAQRLFPKLEVWNKGRGIQLAITDALLIAEYCRRTDR